MKRVRRCTSCCISQNSPLYSTCLDLMRESCDEDRLNILVSQFTSCVHTSQVLLSHQFVQQMHQQSSRPLFLSNDISTPVSISFPGPRIDQKWKFFVQYSDGQWAFTAYRKSKSSSADSILTVSFKCFLCESTRFCSHHDESCRKAAILQFSIDSTQSMEHELTTATDYDHDSNSHSASSSQSSSSKLDDFDELGMFTLKCHSWIPFPIYSPSQLSIIYDRLKWVNENIQHIDGKSNGMRFLNFHECTPTYVKTQLISYLIVYQCLDFADFFIVVIVIIFSFRWCIFCFCCNSEVCTFSFRSDPNCSRCDVTVSRYFCALSDRVFDM
jgi:hypothetical protein